MPNLYAHQTLANNIYLKANADVKRKIDANRELYLLGALASDPLFYYKPLKALPLYNLASEIHNHNIYDLLLNSKNYDGNTQAFLFGYITHFCLDYNTHKYIYEIEKQGYSHSKIETELEKRIVLLNDKKLKNVNFKKDLFLNNNFDTQLLFNISRDVYLKSIKDMRFVVGCLYSRNVLKRFIVKLVLKVTGNYKKHKDLFLNKRDDKNYLKVVNECQNIYLNTFDYASSMINNYSNYLDGKEKLSMEFYKTFEGGLYEGKAN